MNFCTYITDTEEPCGELCEGRTTMCASHNRLIRKQLIDESKSLQKRAQLLSKPKQVRKRVRPVSEKRKELNKEYANLAEQFKIDNPDCYAKIENICTGKTEDVHHSRGRGRYLLEVSSFIPVCRNCHIYVTDHPADSLKRGLSFSRLETNEPHKI